MAVANIFEKEDSSGVSLAVLNKMYRYWLLIKRFWWILLITISGGLAWKFYQIDQRPDEYLSHGRMMVSARLKLPEGVSYSEELANFFGTQIEIMESAEVLEKARKRVLRENPFLEEKAHANIHADQIPQTSIFELEARGTNIDYTRLFLDAVMEEFIAFKRDKRQETSYATISQLTAELSRLKKEQEEQQKAIFEFKQQYNLSYWEARSTSGAEYLSELKDEEARLKTKIRFLESLSLDDKNLSRSGMQDLTSSAILKELPVNEAFTQEYFDSQKKLLKAQVILEDYLQVLKPDHPKVAAIREEIDRLETFVNLLLYRNLEVAKSNISVLKRELVTLQETIDEWEDNVLESSKIQAEYEMLAVSLERTKNLYSNLLSTIQRLEISENINLETIQILQKANPATKAARDWVKGLAQGALIGIILGGAFIILMDVLDDRLVSSIDVQSAFDKPLLSQIPVTKPDGDSGNRILKIDEHRLPFAEAFRNLRSSIIFRQESEQVKSIIITSSFPSEGKSTIAANLAITMAQTGERILLIDGDLRRGNISKIFDIQGEQGLTSALEDVHNWNNYVQATEYPNLSIIPLGKQASQPGELFLRPSIDILMTEAKEHFDRIIIDSAPVLAVTDSASLAPKIDAVIMVVRSGITSLQKARQAIHTLESRQANIFGIVMNAVEPMAPDYGYYKYKSYYY